MKKILFALSFALSFALFVPACMVAPSQDGAAASAQTSVEASTLTATPLDAACLQACEDAFETCAGNATSDFDLCQCDNGRIGCERRCGVFHPFHQC